LDIKKIDMKTTYIDLNLLDRITVVKKRKTGHKWNEKIVPKHKSFLGIKYGKTEGYSEGWGYHRYSTEEMLRNYPYYEVDGINKVMYERPRVVLGLSDGRYYEQYFDTDEEAEDYAFEINEVSGKNLYAIIHN
jgi:hypothetical protein